MRQLSRPIILLALCITAGACAPRGDPGSAKAFDPEVVAANRAKAEAIMQAATEVRTSTGTFLVGHSPDKTYALVDFSEGGRVNAHRLEDVAARATGCDAVHNGGVLKSIPGVTNMTHIRMQGTKRLRVETYCDGDTRQRIAGLPDGLPGTKGQAARFAAYPEVGRTYLSFSHQHGFQVSYYESASKSWLWYPGNSRSLPEAWEIRGSLICFRHPLATYNPVTRETGGNFQCQSLGLSRRITVAVLDGDPFGLAAGTIPYRRDKCDAPADFSFDRSAVGC